MSIKSVPPGGEGPHNKDYSFLAEDFLRQVALNSADALASRYDNSGSQSDLYGAIQYAKTWRQQNHSDEIFDRLINIWGRETREGQLVEQFKRWPSKMIPTGDVNLRDVKETT